MAKFSIRRTPPVLRMASCMAPNADDTCRAIAAYVQRALGLRVEFVDNIPWPERERQLDSGDIHVCWICGLPYVWKADQPDSTIELLAAPVMAARRYGGAPVYFSDVVVRRDRIYAAFDDLRGAHWAYNEPNSHSGCNVVKHHLAKRGERRGFFGRVTESGAHQQSLAMILRGDVDASAIDSTVFEAEIARAPHHAEQLRVIDTLGPSPMPPWVMRRDLPDALKLSLRAVFLEMADDGEGREILKSWGVAQLVEVDNGAYDPIRVMARQAVGVSLTV